MRSTASSVSRMKGIESGLFFAVISLFTKPGCSEVTVRP